VRDGRHGHARYPSNILDRRHAFRPPAQNTFAFIIQIPFSIVNKICANAGFGIYAAKRLGLCRGKQEKPNIRKSDRRYPEILVPGEKVQVDVKEVSYNCLKGAARRDGKHFYQWTAIDECTRIRFIYGLEEHTPENSVKFFKMLRKIFPFKIQTIQTDNGTEFTYKYISDTELCTFDIALKNAGVQHKLIPPRTPWHNGKVERSHRNDQRYFYNWEKFASVEDLNRKLKDHLHWSNRKPMRTLGGKSPLDLLREILSNA
jgi:transposase InsO family protein